MDKNVIYFIRLKKKDSWRFNRKNRLLNKYWFRNRKILSDRTFNYKSKIFSWY